MEMGGGQPVVIKLHFFEHSVYELAKSYRVVQCKHLFITTMQSGMG
jgi:hypothetical protein